MSQLSRVFERPFVESEAIINEIREDIQSFGENRRCFVFYTQVEDNIIFTDYDFLAEEDSLKVGSIKEGEAVIIGTLGEALEAFEEQGWV